MGSAFGAGAGADALRNVLDDLYSRAFKAQDQKRADADLELRRQAQRDSSAYHNEVLRSSQEDRAAKQQAALATEGEKIGAGLTPGANVAGQSNVIRALSAAGLTPQHTDATLSSTNLSGVATNNDAGPGMDAPRITRIARTANPGQAAKDIFQGTAQQHAAAQARIDKQTAIDNARSDKVDAAAQAKADKEDLLKVAAGLRPPPQGHFSFQPGKGPNGEDAMYRVNTQTGETTIVKPGDGGTIGKGPKVNATTENRLQSAKAVVQTGGDIERLLRDPKIAQQLGQVMSRYNNVADFVGNAPPEWSELAGAIESYSLANMGVHGMRSATGAEAIRQTLGQGRHTPESIISALKGLNGFSNHLLENNKGWDSKGGPAQAGGGDPLGIRK